MSNQFHLSFDMGNAAFDEGAAPDECARILRIVAGKVSSGQEGGSIWDSSGNRIGEWSADLPEEVNEEDDGEEN